MDLHASWLAEKNAAGRSRLALRVSLLVLLLALVFVVDTITDREIAVAVFYVAVILVGIRLLPRRGVAVLACCCVVLTIVSLLLTRRGALDAGVANAAISISAIAITTYLGLRLVSAVAAVHESRAQLARIARLSSLGELTASIAHEVNQPMSAIVTSGQACLRWLAMSPPNLERARQSVERMVEDANRTSEVVARVRLLASGAAPEKQLINVNAAIIEALDLAHGELDRQGIAIVLDLSSDALPAWADPVQIQQVIANLILNAIEAMHDTPRGARSLSVSSCCEAGTIAVSIADSGSGLTPEAHNRLFDAFWSSKSDGVGLGLTISRSIVEAHGGRIWVTPRAHGTLVQFTLPADRA
jgi:signal transduction histidine kinase